MNQEHIISPITRLGDTVLRDNYTTETNTFTSSSSVSTLEAAINGIQTYVRHFKMIQPSFETSITSAQDQFAWMVYIMLEHSLWVVMSKTSKDIANQKQPVVRAILQYLARYYTTQREDNIFKSAILGTLQIAALRPFCKYVADGYSSEYEKEYVPLLLDVTNKSKENVSLYSGIMTKFIGDSTSVQSFIDNHKTVAEFFKNNRTNVAVAKKDKYYSKLLNAEDLALELILTDVFKGSSDIIISDKEYLKSVLVDYAYWFFIRVVVNPLYTLIQSPNIPPFLKQDVQLVIDSLTTDLLNAIVYMLDSLWSSGLYVLLPNETYSYSNGKPPRVQDIQFKNVQLTPRGLNLIICTIFDRYSDLRLRPLMSSVYTTFLPISVYSCTLDVDALLLTLPETSPILKSKNIGIDVFELDKLSIALECVLAQPTIDKYNYGSTTDSLNQRVLPLLQGKRLQNDISISIAILLDPEKIKLNVTNAMNATTTQKCFFLERSYRSKELYNRLQQQPKLSLDQPKLSLEASKYFKALVALEYIRDTFALINNLQHITVEEVYKLQMMLLNDKKIPTLATMDFLSDSDANIRYVNVQTRLKQRNVPVIEYVAYILLQRYGKYLYKFATSIFAMKNGATMDTIFHDELEDRLKPENFWAGSY